MEATIATLEPTKRQITEKMKTQKNERKKKNWNWRPRRKRGRYEFVIFTHIQISNVHEHSIQICSWREGENYLLARRMTYLLNITLPGVGIWNMYFFLLRKATKNFSVIENILYLKNAPSLAIAFSYLSSHRKFLFFEMNHTENNSF